ncbi:hypothetical protein [Sulfurimonas sp.]|uniref:hypothetical protein n=1 Tax=Sulfurimonas sp. TaxID=2022749 RepID=UPI003D0AAEBB
MKKENYYLMMDAWGKRPGYPIYFDYDIPCDRSGWEDSCLVQCPQEEIELRVKNPKIEFDFCNSSDNYFFSTRLWEVICEYRSLTPKLKPIKFFGKNRKILSSKEYVVVCFTDENDEKNRYIDRMQSEYVVPIQTYSARAELVNPAIRYELLNQFDITTSDLQGYRKMLVVSETFMKDERLKEMNLEFLPLEEAAKILLYSDESRKKQYGLQDVSEFQKMKSVKGKELDGKELNGMRIQFG